MEQRADAIVISGKTVAGGIERQVAEEASQISVSSGAPPGLAVVMVGDDPASQLYVRKKAEKARQLGIRAQDHLLPFDCSLKELTALIDRLNDDDCVHGILVQLPLPLHIPADAVLECIRPDKDVDGFHPVNRGLLAAGLSGRALIPCTPLGSLILLRSVLGSLSGLDAVVVGRSNIVGKPMAQLLLQADCTVTMVHSRSRNMPEQCRRGDILVAAVGKAHFIRGDWLKEGATVIDVGINRAYRQDNSWSVIGDVMFAEALPRVKAITPVPGGVGPMTIACLLANTVTAAQRHLGRPTFDWFSFDGAAGSPQAKAPTP
ncbi:MAG: bifunctional methylenetetrahydrofolate dehydrogenase/methenyltetrahydrofolate cyclohydrolase FolD [Pseudomonadota bacterium]|nr:bifunctional methylenetetrahydrofolate dehydrogenase/methenyltetrahydrofolate cyclohydrolase FolD [Pseudomonadota bacterium]